MNDASKEQQEAMQMIRRLTALASAFMRYFNPNDMPEDQSQQWQQLEHQVRAANAFLASQPAA